MSAKDLIERCAAVADDTAMRLKASKPTARRHKHDRQSQVEIDYAIRMVKRVADGIRALDVTTDEVFAPPRDPRLVEARAILRDILPSIKKGRDSAWRASTIERIQALLKD